MPMILRRFGGTVMNQKPCNLDFFLGASTPAGFVSFFDDVTTRWADHHSYVIKGGAGTGKSTLMKRCALEGLAHGDCVERIHCSSDPFSLDGVILQNAKITMVDGTPPHVVEPEYPGAYETVVNFCDCWNEELLQHRRQEIIELFALNKLFRDQCKALLEGAGSLLCDNRFALQAEVNLEKVARAADGILARECHLHREQRGVEHKRFASAVTPQGIISYALFNVKDFERVYLIKDVSGAAAQQLLLRLREELLARGVTLYSCFCPLDPSRLEHLVIPELSLAFLTANRFHPMEADGFLPYRVIHASRFIPIEAMRARKQHLRFHQRMAGAILEEAVAALAAAKTVHDDIEAIYGEAMDYRAIDRKAADVLQQIGKAYEFR